MLICGHCGAIVKDLQGLAVHLRCEEKPLPLVEVENTSTNSARYAITPLVVRAVTTDGSHHKQWYLEAIAEALQIELPPHDLGIAP